MNPGNLNLWKIFDQTCRKHLTTKTIALPEGERESAGGRFLAASSFALARNVRCAIPSPPAGVRGQRTHGQGEGGIKSELFLNESLTSGPILLALFVAPEVAFDPPGPQTI